MEQLRKIRDLKASNQWVESKPLLEDANVDAPFRVLYADITKIMAHWYAAVQPFDIVVDRYLENKSTQEEFYAEILSVHDDIFIVALPPLIEQLQ